MNAFGGGRVLIADDWEERILIDPMVKSLLGLRDVVKAKKRRQDFAARWCQASEAPDEWLDRKDRRAFQSVFDRLKAAFGFTTRDELTFRWWQRLSAEPDAANEDLAIDFDHITVDEYQDLNECEHEILEELSNHGVEVFVVGDPNQSIYESLRHAHPAVCLSFEERFAESERVVLNESYRCPSAILDAARALMEGTTTSEMIPSISHRDVEGEIELVNYADETAEASGIARVATKLAEEYPESKILILVPIKKIGALISGQIKVDHVRAFQKSNELEPDRARLARAMARLLGDPGDALAAATAILLHAAKTHRVTTLRLLVDVCAAQDCDAAEILADYDVSPIDRLDRAVDLTRSTLDKLKKMPLQQAVARLEKDGGVTGVDVYFSEDGRRGVADERLNDRSSDEEDEPIDELVPGITVCTYHYSKGLEADLVFLAGVEPHFFEGDDRSTPAERRRLLFVGLTRSTTAVFASYASRRKGPSRYAAADSGSSRRGMSEFLDDIREALDIQPVSGTKFVREWLR